MAGILEGAEPVDLDRLLGLKPKPGESPVPVVESKRSEAGLPLAALGLPVATTSTKCCDNCVRKWLCDRCVFDGTVSTPARDLLADYQSWAAKGKHKTYSNGAMLGRAIGKVYTSNGRDPEEIRFSSHKGNQYWLKLKPAGV